jgi:hypothetical protein
MMQSQFLPQTMLIHSHSASVAVRIQGTCSFKRLSTGTERSNSARDVGEVEST